MNVAPRDPLRGTVKVNEEAGETEDSSFVRVGANMAVAVIGGVSGLAILGPLGAIGGAIVGAAAAPLIRSLHEHRKSHNVT